MDSLNPITNWDVEMNSFELGVVQARNELDIDSNVMIMLKSGNPAAVILRDYFKKFGNKELVLEAKVKRGKVKVKISDLCNKKILFQRENTLDEAKPATSLRLLRIRSGKFLTMRIIVDNKILNKIIMERAK